MEEEIVKDYGKTVSAQTYIDTLKGHQYIPQSDHKILKIIESLAKERANGIRIYDIGCGPGRLTFDIARISNVAGIVGWDISPSFIKYAYDMLSTKSRMPKCEFRQCDCTKPLSEWAQPVVPVDAIVLQGVMHHMHGNDRQLLIENLSKILEKDGFLMIGDEFICDYGIDEDQRRLEVCRFYCHIIAEALKGGFEDLATEEAKNLIDDVLAGKKGAGYTDDNLIKYIFDQALKINQYFYEGRHELMRDHSRRFVGQVSYSAGNLEDASPGQSMSRGDLKISLRALMKEFGKDYFVHEDTYCFGPVNELGGMAVLTFKLK